MAEPRSIIRRILERLRTGRRFFVTGHLKPDPDTVGSALALASLIHRLGPGKLVDLVTADPIPSNTLFLPGASRIRTAGRVKGHFDVAIILECNGPHRMGNIIDIERQAATTINIDHHISFQRFGDINFINPRASSNAEQVYRLYQTAGIRPNRREATYLYAGLLTDTGRFQHSNTTSETHQTAAALLACGVQPHKVHEELYGKKPQAALRLLGTALNGLRIISRRRIALLSISRQQFQQVRARQDDSEEIVNYGMLIPSVLVSVLLREDEEIQPSHRRISVVRVSLRSKAPVDVCAVAKAFGGGGHRRAAGCSLPGTLSTVTPRLIRGITATFHQR
ncbi:MAG: bifunctional oligoribonuclease/PAP phosphatase NrnA [Elusimicrobia bacterium]|nr:bifunctional oligoribonuclease/PAP phosphatase NrnA [Elusimicrobiota bacterium]